MEVTKENSFYLAVKQNVFDDIVSGKVKEFRYDIKDTTFLRLLKTVRKEPVFDPQKISANNKLCCDPMVYNNGVFPFFIKEYKFLFLAVGFAKLRDTALIPIKKTEVVVSKKEDGTVVRLSFDDDGNGHPDPNGDYTIWTVVYHLGKINQLIRKDGSKSSKS
jgi:hypothetical protein